MGASCKHEGSMSDGVADGTKDIATLAEEDDVGLR
jgi:hypothetical protein